jgi:hypothetical protein
VAVEFSEDWINMSLSARESVQKERPETKEGQRIRLKALRGLAFYLYLYGRPLHQLTEGEVCFLKKVKSMDSTAFDLIE